MAGAVVCGVIIALVAAFFLTSLTAPPDDTRPRVASPPEPVPVERAPTERPLAQHAVGEPARAPADTDHARVLPERASARDTARAPVDSGAAVTPSASVVATPPPERSRHGEASARGLWGSGPQPLETLKRWAAYTPEVRMGKAIIRWVKSQSPAESQPPQPEPRSPQTR